MFQESFYFYDIYLQAQFWGWTLVRSTKKVHTKLVQLMYNAQNGLKDNDFLVRLSAWYIKCNFVHDTWSSFEMEKAGGNDLV